MGLLVVEQDPAYARRDEALGVRRDRGLPPTRRPEAVSSEAEAIWLILPPRGHVGRNVR